MFQNIVCLFLLFVACSGNTIPFIHESSVPDGYPKRTQTEGLSFPNRPMARRLSGETEDVSFEDSVIRSMLQIVDIKFDTLSTRLLSLERGINNMQFYLSRQFNQVTKNLQAVNMVMNSLHGEISHVDIETRTVKNSIHALSKEFLDYRNTNTGVFGELPSHHILTEDIQRKPPEIIHGNFVDKTHTYFPDKVNLEDIEEVLDNQSYPLNLNHLQTYIEKGFKALDESIKTHVSSLLSNITIKSQPSANISSDYTRGENVIKSEEFKEINGRLEKLEASINKSDNDHNTLVSRVKFVNDHARDTIRTGPANASPQRLIKRSKSVDFKDEFSAISDELEIISAKNDEIAEYMYSNYNTLEVSKNNSERIVKLVEAVSSSTIWIPHILYEINTLSKVLNESLSSTHILYKALADSKSELTPAENSDSNTKGILSKLFNKKTMGSSAFIDGDMQRNPANCEINERDLKLIQRKVLQVEEYLDTFVNRNLDTKITKDIHEGFHARVKLEQARTIGSSTQGIITMKVGSNWQHVCYVANNSSMVASLTCQQLGFASGVPAIYPIRSQSNDSITMVECWGEESNLFQCGLETVPHDKCTGVLGAACQGHY
ncbi:CAE1316385.1unnamed protein product [Argonauta hians]